MDICTFWYGDTLRKVDQICLSSMIRTGQHVKLFSYTAAVNGMPKGVELCNAEEILPQSMLYRIDPNYPNYKPWVTILQFSDFFRVLLMKHKQGVWLDTDIYLARPFFPNPDSIWFALENRKRVGVSALYLPPENPIIKTFENWLLGKNLVPEWLGFKRRVLRPAFLRARGLPVQPNRLGITIFGNDGISRLAKYFGFFNKAHAKETFYYWTGRKSERIFDPAYGLEPLLHPLFIGFHIHRKVRTEMPPLKESFFDLAVKGMINQDFVQKYRNNRTVK